MRGNQGFFKSLGRIWSRYRSNDYFVPMPDENSSGCYADINMKWVDEAIESYLPGSKPVSPFLVSASLGGFGDEFDKWRQDRGLNEHVSFQVVYILSTDVFGACLHLASNNSYTNWRGHVLPGDNVGILFVDYELTSHVAGTQFRLLFDQEMSVPDALILCLSNPNNENAFVVEDEDISVIDKGRILVSALASQHNDSGITKGAQSIEARSLIDLRGNETGNFKSFTQSAIIHFIQTHEFAHYCLESGADAEVIRKTHCLVNQFSDQYCSNVSPELHEEIFCDFLAIDNCVEQMLMFEVPPVFTIFGALWTLHYASVSISNRHDAQQTSIVNDMKIRRAALCYYWGRLFDDSNGDLVFASAEKVNAYLGELASCVHKHLRI